MACNTKEQLTACHQKIHLVRPSCQTDSNKHHHLCILDNKVMMIVNLQRSANCVEKILVEDRLLEDTLYSLPDNLVSSRFYIFSLYMSFVLLSN